MSHKENGVWLDGVKLKPVSSTLSELPLLNNRGLNEVYTLIILDHPIQIHLNGDCSVTLWSDSFIDCWVDKGVMEAYNEASTGEPTVAASKLAVVSSTLTNVTFFGDVRVEACSLEGCDLIHSTLSAIWGYDNPITKGVWFQNTYAHNVAVDGPGMFVGSTLSDVQFNTKEGASFEVAKSTVFDTSITGGAIFLGHTDLSEVELISEESVRIVGIKMHDFCGYFPRIELRGIFDYFNIALPSLYLSLVVDTRDNSNMWVVVSKDCYTPEELGVASNQPGDGFRNWLLEKVIPFNDQHADSIVNYVKECIESRLNVIGHISATNKESYPHVTQNQWGY